ncbi:hypothetical protein ACOMHN_055563 [Nucella lapillus]
MADKLRYKCFCLLPLLLLFMIQEQCCMSSSSRSPWPAQAAEGQAPSSGTSQDRGSRYTSPVLRASSAATQNSSQVSSTATEDRGGDGAMLSQRSRSWASSSARAQAGSLGAPLPSRHLLESGGSSARAHVRSLVALLPSRRLLESRGSGSSPAMPLSSEFSDRVREGPSFTPPPYIPWPIPEDRHPSEQRSPFLSPNVQGKDFFLQAAAAYYDYCGNMCEKGKPSYGTRPECKRCFCDKICFIFRDCCPNMYVNVSHPVGSSHVSHALRCSPASFGNRYSHKYVMQTRCPNVTQTSLKLQCESSDTSHWKMTQPFTSLDTFYTYKNRYCAHCHSDAANLRPWKLELNVRNSATLVNATTPQELYEAALKDEDNELDYKYPDSVEKHVRECLKGNVISTCNVTGRWPTYDVSVDRACRLFNVPIMGLWGESYYSNPFCYLCNSYDTWTKMLNTYLSTVVSKGDVALLMLVDFTDDDDDDDGDERSTRDEQASRCSEHQFYDLLTESCRAVQCPPGKQPSPSMTCASFPLVTNMYGHELCLYSDVTAREMDRLTELMDHESLSDEVSGFFYRNLADVEYNSLFPEDEGKPREESDVVLVWVSRSCLFLSLVFLLVSLVIYSLLSSLRTVAGLNNLLLIVVLIGAQLLLLVVSSDLGMAGWLCQVVAVLTHYLWLAVLFAQNACTFHMFYTLSFPLLSHAAMASPATLTRKYFTYVLLTSALFVGVTLIWQWAAEGDSGYGGSKCFLLRAVVHGVMFGLPLACTVCVNLVMFLVTLWRLRSVQRVSSTRGHRSSLVLYTKLSVFTGLTWLLGFLALGTGSVLLLYLFAMFQGCQGLFIFLAFLANTHVMGMLRDRLRGVDTTPTTSSGITTRTKESDHVQLREAQKLTHI